MYVVEKIHFFDRFKMTTCIILYVIIGMIQLKLRNRYLASNFDQNFERHSKNPETELLNIIIMIFEIHKIVKNVLCDIQTHSYIYK